MASKTHSNNSHARNNLGGGEAEAAAAGGCVVVAPTVPTLLRPAIPTARLEKFQTATEEAAAEDAEDAEDVEDAELRRGGDAEAAEAEPA